MSGIEDLYQEIILDHNKRPRHFGPLTGATHQADGLNPLCGDQLKVLLRLEGGGQGVRIGAASFQGQGCAISKASASMLTEAVTGQTPERARALAHRVLAAVQPHGEDLILERDGEVAALLGVRKFPARVKCATLAWHALLSALDSGASVSTESAEDRR